MVGEGGGGGGGGGASPSSQQTKTKQTFFAEATDGTAVATSTSDTTNISSKKLNLILMRYLISNELAKNVYLSSL